MKAIVTGHSKGLGAALAGELARRGVHVLGLARGHSAELARQWPQRVTQVALDLADSGALADWLARPDLADFFAGSPVALLINNAGTGQPVGASSQQDVAAVGMAVALNVAAPLMLSAAVARLACERRILHISSGAGRSPYAGWNVYCATKAALDHHARAAALDAVPGLRICSLAPGIIDTGMQAEIRTTAPALFPGRERFVDLHRKGELVDPAACAVHVVDYLLAAAFGSHPVDDLRSAAAAKRQ